MRSNRGAGFAVDAAIEVLEWLSASMVGATDDVAREEAVAQAKDRIVSRWNALVEEDLALCPLGEDELSLLVQRGVQDRPLHAYGTTLVAGVLVGTTWVFVQQGDGLCLLVREDGSIDAPMPKDSACVGNVTTSMAGWHVADQMRHAFVDDATSSVVAVFLSSDGVDKSFVGASELSEFMLRLLVWGQGRSEAELDEGLEGVLAQLSANGSGDDCSLAGAMRLDLGSVVRDRLEQRRQWHETTSQLAQAQAKLVSMRRKHDRLEELWLAGKVVEAARYPSYHEAYERLQGVVATCEEQLASFDDVELGPSIG